MNLRTQLMLLLLPVFVLISAATFLCLPYSSSFLSSLLLITVSTSCMAAFLYFIANKISQPIRSLSKSALTIAAGHYGESVPVEGPQEIRELSNTLNTLSECLAEQINRLRESSLLRERMYGEYECAMLLQHLMLQKNIDECKSDLVAAKSVSLYSAAPRGLLLNFPKTTPPHLFSIHMAEAKEDGLEGIYELLTDYKLTKAPLLQMEFDALRSQLTYKGNHPPLIWSAREEQLRDPSKGPIEMESGDLFFLYNEGLLHFQNQRLPEFLSKVLRIFAPEGLEIAAKMLQKELALASKRKKLENDLHLLCFQIL